MSQKTWYLYLIECQDGSIYTGITVDVIARYEAHQNGSGALISRTARRFLLAPFSQAMSRCSVNFSRK